MIALRSGLLTGALCILATALPAPPCPAETRAPGAAGPGAKSSGLEFGLRLYSEGNFTQAADVFRSIASASRGDSQIPLYIETTGYLADIYRDQGKLRQSIAILKPVRPVAEATGNARLIGPVYGRLGAAYTRIGEFDLAESYLAQGAELARSTGDESLLASLLNDQGNLLVLNGKLSAAIRAFQSSIDVARKSGNHILEVSARNNLVRTYLEQGRIGPVAALLAENRKLSRQLPGTPLKTQSLLAIGVLYHKAQQQFSLPAVWREKAHAAFTEGLALARQLHDSRLESYALGYLGGLYEDEGRTEEALPLTQQAAFIAQKVSAYDSLYLWEWQLARLAREDGDIDQALTAYKQALNSLQKIRSGLAYSTYGGFKQKVGPVYSEYADLLLSRAHEAKDPEATGLILAEVRTTLEQAKVAEVENYFQDECVVDHENLAYVERLSGDIAVIYPVLLEDRTEILASLPDGIHQFTTGVGAAALTREARQLRTGLETYDSQNRYLPGARTLYRWLIQPLEEQLEKQDIRTLVFVPDGALRSIPLSALHDGDEFLVEKYAIATTPGLTLTDPKPIARDKVRVLANGITESVQGYPALPSVEAELDSIQALFPNNTVLKNQGFILDNVRTEMSEGSYSIVHLATHGVFDSDHRKSFLLAYDEKFTMDRLGETISVRRYQEEPIELLVLSACQTAAGDDRAALGLAGVAIQSGARSALASLWYISDQATAELVAEFYNRLRDSGTSKAEALRQAQLHLLQQRQYRHPAFWAPYLIIGNWL